WRSPIEKIEVHDCFPKQFQRHISDAILAQQCGQVLSGLFQLRVFIEQFYTVPPRRCNKGVDEPPHNGKTADRERRANKTMSFDSETARTQPPSRLSACTRKPPSGKG